MSNDVQMQNKNIQVIQKMENEIQFQEMLRKIQIEIISLKQSGLDLEAKNKYITFLIFLQNNACYVKDVTPYLDNLEANKSKFSPVEYHLFRQKLQEMRNSHLPKTVEKIEEKVVEEIVKSAIFVEDDDEEEIKPPIFHEDTQRDIKKLKRLLNKTNEKLEALEDLIKTSFVNLENRLNTIEESIDTEYLPSDESESESQSGEDWEKESLEEDEDEEFKGNMPDEKLRSISLEIRDNFCPTLLDGYEVGCKIYNVFEIMFNNFHQKFIKTNGKLKLTRKSLSKFIKENLIHVYNAIYPDMFDTSNKKDVKCLEYLFTRNGNDKELLEILKVFIKEYYGNQLVFLKAKGKVVSRPRYL